MCEIICYSNLNKCCNIDSYGEFCVMCGRCNKKITELTVSEFVDINKAIKLLHNYAIKYSKILN